MYLVFITKRGHNTITKTNKRLNKIYNFEIYVFRGSEYSKLDKY